jgi:NAD(P)H-hydrate epimerase
MRYEVLPRGRGSGHRIVSGTEMRAIDGAAIDGLGVPGLALMENAARHVALAVAALAPPTGLIAVLCGRGNNGGDGFAAARHLQAWGFEVELIVCGAPAQLSADAAVHFKVAQAMGLALQVLDTLPAAQQFFAGGAPYTVVVDALLGTGLQGPVRGVAALAVGWVNRSELPVVAVDIGSGLCSASGAVLGEAVRATRTVTFGASKLGHWLGAGPEHSGHLQIVDIGLPAGLIEAHSSVRRLLGEHDLACAFAARPATAHKGWAGHLYVVAGDVGRTGAARMTADAALSAGAGLVTIGTTEAALPGLGPQLYEVMAEALLAGTAEDAGRLLAAVEARSAAVIGPGLSASTPLREVLLAALPQITVPVVLDAEALNQLVGHLPVLGQGGPRVLTPHPGEAGRLLGITAQAVQADRVAALQSLVASTGAVVVLKGAHTLVGAPDGRIGLCPEGNPGMASAGMGDALAGVLGALLARGVSVFEAACAAVMWHARAGDRASQTHGINGLRARAVIEALPVVELEAS